MPQIGELQKAKDCGFKGRHKYIWHACIDCGNERWVMLRLGSPECLLCRSCSSRSMRKGASWGVRGNLLGSSRIDSWGYVCIYDPSHPYAKDGRYVKRARLVLEEKLGRYLLDGMVTHHINGIKHDDSLVNLMEISQSEHCGMHNKERVYARR